MVRTAELEYVTKVVAVNARFEAKEGLVTIGATGGLKTEALGVIVFSKEYDTGVLDRKIKLSKRDEMFFLPRSLAYNLKLISLQGEKACSLDNLHKDVMMMRNLGFHTKNNKKCIKFISWLGDIIKTNYSKFINKYLGKISWSGKRNIIKSLKELEKIRLSIENENQESSKPTVEKLKALLKAMEDEYFNNIFPKLSKELIELQNYCVNPDKNKNPVNLASSLEKNLKVSDEYWKSVGIFLEKVKEFPLFNFEHLEMKKYGSIFENGAKENLKDINNNECLITTIQVSQKNKSKVMTFFNRYFPRLDIEIGRVSCIAQRSIGFSYGSIFNKKGSCFLLKIVVV